MAHRVLIPTPLRPYTSQQDTVDAEGGTVGEVLSALTSQFTDLKRHLYADDGKLRSFVNVYVNDDDIRYLERDATKLKPGDVISIVPSVAGGAPGPAAAERSTELSNAEIQRYSRHLILPEVGIDGQRQAQGGARPLRRRRRARLAGSALSRRGRRRHARHRRFRRRRRQQPAATDSARHAGRRPLEAAVRSRPPDRPSTPRSTSRRYETRLTSANALEIFKGLRRHPRRHRQLPDALSRQRRLRAAQEAQRLRQHLPLRRPGVGLRDDRRPVLSLPLSRAAAPGAGPELRRRRRPRRAAGRHRHDPGDRSDQARSSARARRSSAGCCSTTPGR